MRWLLLFTALAVTPVPQVVFAAGQGKSADEAVFAKGIQGCWDEELKPADKAGSMSSRVYCFEGGVKGDLSANYMSVNEGWGDLFKYELISGKLVIKSDRAAGADDERSYAVCDAEVFPKRSLKLHNCKGGNMAGESSYSYSQSQ